MSQNKILNVVNHLFPDCIQNKKATMNSINGYGKCFQYAATIVLNYEKNRKKLSNNNETFRFYKKI